MSSLALARLLVPDVRGLPRAFWLLFSAALIDRIGGFAAPYLAIYLTANGDISVGTAGIIISLMAFGGVVGTPLGGALADRFGRKPLLVGGLLLTAAAWIHVAFARGTAHLAVAVLLAGVAASLARPAMVAAIADVVPEEDRRRAFGLHYWAINLGFAVAASLAGVLSGVSWGLVFGLDAATSVLAALLLFLAMKNTGSHDPHDDGPRVGIADMLAGPVKDGVFMLLVLEGLMMSAIFSQCSLALATDMKSDGLAVHYGPLLAINGVLIVLLQPSLTQVTARLHPSRVLGAGCALVGLGFFATTFCDTWWQHGLAIAVWTLGEILIASTMPSVVAKLAPANRRATYQGMYQLSWSAASFAPALGAFILESAGSRTLWTLCLAAGLVGVLIQVRLAKSPRMR